ncbi:uncharacterized protein LOC135097021 isoform X2 [Scylla paramamosain]|uniref:uncharacterized protein LOC135097021 isoform X2 n=1 Tax=Scylla paramamosain TaxID=85552 RepID=UPI00308388B5
MLSSPLELRLGHSKKDGEVRQARLNSRMQPEFTKMPSRRYPVSQPVNTCSSLPAPPCLPQSLENTYGVETPNQAAASLSGPRSQWVTLRSEVTWPQCTT